MMKGRFSENVVMKLSVVICAVLCLNTRVTYAFKSEDFKVRVEKVMEYCCRSWFCFLSTSLSFFYFKKFRC